MRYSQLFAPTMRELSADVEMVSHRLLLRAGFIRQLSAGVYTFLPLGWRVLQKISDIVRQEMNRAGAQELLMPALTPQHLWAESGREATMMEILLGVKDRWTGRSGRARAGGIEHRPAPTHRLGPGDAQPAQAAPG